MTYRFPVVLCSHISFRLSVRQVVSSVIVEGSTLFYFLSHPIWAHPLDSGPLHAVGQTTFDGLDVRVLGAVPLGNKALLREADGNAADLSFFLSIAMPGPVVVIPTIYPHHIIKPGLDGPVGHIGDRQSPFAIFFGLL